MKPQDFETYFSYTTKGPIKAKEQMIKSIDISNITLDPSRTFSSMWWSTAYIGERTNTEKYYMHLKQRLVSFAGIQASLQFADEHYSSIFIRGQLWYNDRVDAKEYFDECPHEVTVNLYTNSSNKKDIAIATGYALCTDGIWRRHSWLLIRKSRSVRIIEPESKRVAYFGFVLDEQESREFCNKFMKED